MGLSEVTFSIFKSTDKSIFEGVRETSKETDFTVLSVNLLLFIGGNEVTVDSNGFDSNEDLITILGQNSELTRRFQFQVTAQKFSFGLTINRDPKQPLDSVTLQFAPVSVEHRKSLYAFVSNLRKTLKAADSSDAIQSALGEAHNQVLRVQQSQLSHLSGIAQSLIVDQEKYRQRLEASFDDRERKLEEKYDQRHAELNEEKKALEKVHKEIDDRQSRHARRDLRKTLKVTFQERSQKFHLSSGTVDLRRPITIFTVVLLVVFGGLFLLSSLASFKLFGLSTEGGWSYHLKHMAYAFAFGATAIFYIRWNNRWFERHAGEEFLLKRQEIDIDRASWVAELASEWAEEKKRDLPQGLLDKLTKNLFELENQPDPVLHPAEELANAIFGASSRAKVKLPNDTELELDRKAIQHLQKPITLNQ